MSDTGYQDFKQLERLITIEDISVLDQLRKAVSTLLGKFARISCTAIRKSFIFLPMTNYFPYFAGFS